MLGELPAALVALVVLPAGGLAIIMLRAYPVLNARLLFGSLTLLPFWLGFSVSYFFVNAQLAVILLCSVALVFAEGPHTRFTAPDLLMLVLVSLILVGFRLFGVSLNSVWTTFSQWLPAYLAGRFVAARVRWARLADSLSVLGAVCGVLGVIEFLTSFNPWIRYLPMANSLFATWGTLQSRGSLVRAEGAFGHSIAFASVMAMIAVITLSSRFAVRVKTVLLVCTMAGVAVSLSRVGMIAVGLGLVLAVFLIRTGRVRRMRTPALVMLGFAAVVAGVSLASDLNSAEAADSANYRTWILDLIPSLQPLGPASSALKLADGTQLFGGFRSIDSALLYIGLQNGWLPMLVVVAMALAAAVVVLRGRGNVATVAAVAQIPALVSVALITQYGMVLFLFAGMAVTLHAGTLPIEDKKDGEVSDETHQDPEDRSSPTSSLVGPVGVLA